MKSSNPSASCTLYVVKHSTGYASSFIHFEPLGKLIGRILSTHYTTYITTILAHSRGLWCFSSRPTMLTTHSWGAASTLSNTSQTQTTCDTRNHVRSNSTESPMFELSAAGPSRTLLRSLRELPAALRPCCVLQQGSNHMPALIQHQHGRPSIVSDRQHTAGVRPRM